MATAVTTTDFSTAPINAKLSTERKLRLLTDMVRIRRFEGESLRQYTQKKWAASCISTMARNPWP